MNLSETTTPSNKKKIYIYKHPLAMFLFHFRFRSDGSEYVTQSLRVGVPVFPALLLISCFLIKPKN